MGVKADAYRSLLESGPPVADPTTPEEDAALFQWNDSLASAKLEVAEEERELMKPHPLEPEDLTSDPMLQQLYAGALAGGIVPQREIIHTPQPLPLDVAPERTKFTKGAEVEETPEKAQLLDANLVGFDPLVQARLLQVYADTLGEGGSKNDAYRRFLLYRRDTLNGDSETGWPEFPGGAPNEQFWKRFNDQEVVYSQDNPQERTVNYLRDMYNFYRTQGIPKYTEAELAGEDLSNSTPIQVKNALHRLGFDGKGPLDPFDAYTAVMAYAREHPQKFAVRKNRQSLDFDLMSAAAGGPLAPVARGLFSGVAGIASVLASRTAQSQLPEGTPDSVRTAVNFGLYGIGNKGAMSRRLIEGASIAVTAGAGETVAEKAGVPGIVGSFGGPVLAPATASLVKRQFQFMLEQAGREAQQHPERLQASIQKLAINLEKDDVGSAVAIGDNLGIVDGLIGKDHLQVMLDNGLSVTVRRDDVIHVPGMGKAATVGSEAARLKAGAALGDEDLGVVLTPEGMDSIPTRETAIHYTAPENAESILKTGFKPSVASRESYPGVYVVPPGSNARIAEGSLDSSAVFVEVPSGAVADAATAERVRSRLGVGKDAEGNIRVARELQDQGYVGIDQRPGSRVYFDTAALKPSMVARGAETWDDFYQFAKGVVTGEARVTMISPVSGGATIQGLSKETNQLVSAVTTNAYDWRMLATAIRDGTKVKNLPATTWGAGYLFAKSVIGLNPGLTKMLQPTAFAVSNYMEGQQVRIATSMFTLQKAVKEAFGEQFLSAPEGRHLRSSYTGPALKGDPSDYVVGTLSHAIDQPELYNLTQVQKDVIDLWQSMLRSDALVTEKAGVSFDLLEDNYVPYKRKDTDPTFAQRLLSPKTRGQGTGTAKPGFVKHRGTKSLTQWAGILASTGELAETDPFKLYFGRLQGAAKLRSDQTFLRSVVKVHGRQISTPAQIAALQKTKAKVQAQITGRLKTAVAQSGRQGGLQTGGNRIEKLLQDTEKELQKVDDKLFNTTGIDSPVWNNLEGKLQALDKEADLIAQTALRQDKSISDTMARHARTKKEIAVLRGQLKGLQTQLKDAKRATPPHGWTEVGIGKGLGGRYMVPDDVAKEMRSILDPQPVGDRVAVAKETLDWFRGILLSVDGSFLTNQGYALAATDPVKYMTNFGSLAQASMTTEGFMQYMTHNLDAFTRFASAGGVLYTRATDIVEKGGSELVGNEGKLFRKHPIDMTPGVAQLNDFGYGRMLPVMKMMGWQTMNHMLDNISKDKTLAQQVFSVTPFVGDKANTFLRRLAGVEGKSPLELQKAAADVINNVGGGINYGKIMSQPTLASQLVFLTEGWMRANIGRIVTAAKVGDPAGVLARRWMFQNLAQASAISTFLSLMLAGRTPNYDPTASDFLDIQVGASDDLEGGSIPFLPGKTYIRAAFQGIAGVPWETEDSEIEQRVGAITRFGQGRTGQVLRLGMDLVSGKDYLGRPIDNRWLYVGRNMAPVAIQNLADNYTGHNPNAALSTGIGFAGLNWIPRNPYDARDARVQEESIVDPVTEERLLEYGALTDSQRAEFDKAHPEYTESVVAWQEERDSPFAALRRVRNAHRSAVEVLGKAFQGRELDDYERTLLGSDGANVEQIRGNTRLYRQMLGNLSDFYRQEAARQGQGDESFAPKSTAQAIVSGYYTEVIDKAQFGGGLDYTVLDANERAYRRDVEAKYGQDGLNVLDEELLFRTTDDPVAQAYHKDQLLWNPYFDYLDSFWTPENLTYAGLSPDSANTASGFPNREQYEQWLGQAYVDQLVGQPLPENILKLKSSSGADTLGKKWGITPGKRLTEQQAQDIGEELVRIQMKKYTDLVGKASDEWLKQNNDALCAMAYWNIVEPSEATRPWLVTCQVSRVP